MINGRKILMVFSGTLILINTVFIVLLIERVYFPIWIWVGASILCTLVFMYWYIKSKSMINSGKVMQLKRIYKLILKMSISDKKEFTVSEEARYYFETLEQVKKVLSSEEISKYKKVLFGTEDPYIVTAEGKIIVKACPGDMNEQK